MSLKHKLDSLEGLDEALKPLYAKGDDGRYTLQVDEAPATSTIAKLKADLATATKALADRETNEAKAKADAEKVQLEAKGDYEKLKLALESEKIALLKQVEEAQGGLKSYLLKAELTQAIAANKGNQHLLKLIQDQFEAVISPDGAHKVLVKGDPTKTPAQFVEALKKDASYGAFFEGSGASGGGAATGTGTPNGGKAWKEMNLDERSALYKSNPTQALALQNGA